jgi:hypothetical protein
MPAAAAIAACLSRWDADKVVVLTRSRRRGRPTRARVLLLSLSRTHQREGRKYMSGGWQASVVAFLGRGGGQTTPSGRGVYDEPSSPPRRWGKAPASA